jgi:hypothetical protein
MILESLPIHWGFLFQLLVLFSIVVILLQIKYVDAIDKIRHSTEQKWIFQLRRAFMFGQLLALIWMVIYGHNKGWQPWPPLAVFLILFDARIISEILILRIDFKRLCLSPGTTSPLSGRL